MRLILPAIFLLCVSCQIDKGKQVDRDKFDFKTGDDTELFFKNVRQSYYTLEENKQAKFNLFRFESTPRVTDRPQLTPTIVINYLKDEAYVMIEPNAFFEDYQPITFQWQDSALQTGEITLPAYNREAMLEFSTQVYEAILKNHDFTVLLNEERYDILTDSKEREAFRVVMSDYYRLTRVF